MDNCRNCGNPGSNTCSKCKTVNYCSRECQRADWHRHKRVDCITALDAEKLLPPGFIAGSYIMCMQCSQNLLLCPCTGLGDQDLIYVMDPIPEEFTVLQRIQRWGLLVSRHRSFTKFNVEQFVKDLPASFEKDLIETKPVIQGLMEQYKTSTTGNGLHDTCKVLGMDEEGEGYTQSCKDCDYVMEHFFKGQWGYPTILEFSYLNNAVQQSGPEDFDVVMAPRIRRVFDALSMILGMYKAVGVTNLNYRLEDLRNNDGPPSSF